MCLVGAGFKPAPTVKITFIWLFQFFFVPLQAKIVKTHGRASQLKP